MSTSDHTDAGAITPDEKDWTWVVNQPCPDCGLDPDAVTQSELPTRLRESAAAVAVRLFDPDVTERPDPQTWSKLEYGAHVRDVCAVMRSRLALMIDQDEPTFANWDQDAAAIEGRYAYLDPATVADELDAAALDLAQAYSAVPDESWDRAGLRSNGSFFTVWTLGLYALHDLNHHAWDVSKDTD